MNYDESQIKIETITIDGKQVKLYRIPTGMSGPTPIKFHEDNDIPESEDDEELDEIKSIEGFSELDNEELDF